MYIIQLFSVCFGRYVSWLCTAFKRVSSINCSYAFLCSQGPVEDRCDSSRPSEENPQQHSVHAPADVPVPDGHSAGMTTGGAGRRAGQLAEELPAGEPNPIGARQNRDYHPDLRMCFRRGTIIPYPTDQIATGPPGFVNPSSVCLFGLHLQGKPKKWTLFVLFSSLITFTMLIQKSQ